MFTIYCCYTIIALYNSMRSRILALSLSVILLLIILPLKPKRSSDSFNHSCILKTFCFKFLTPFSSSSRILLGTLFFSSEYLCFLIIVLIELSILFFFQNLFWYSSTPLPHLKKSYTCLLQTCFFQLNQVDHTLKRHL